MQYIKDQVGSSDSSRPRISVQSSAPVSETKSDERPAIFGFPIDRNSFIPLDDDEPDEEEQTAVNSVAEYESDEEEVTPLLDPRRHRKQSVVEETASFRIPQTVNTIEWKPRKPPTFSGRPREGVHQWVAVASEYFTLIPGNAQQDDPRDWKSLFHALILRFGSIVRSQKALLKILKMQQDDATVLQYAAKFESCMAQMKEYDEHVLTTKYILGLRSEYIESVFLQYPKSVQEAKQAAEQVEVAHKAGERFYGGDVVLHHRKKNQSLKKKRNVEGVQRKKKKSGQKGKKFSCKSAVVKTRSNEG